MACSPVTISGSKYLEECLRGLRLRLGGLGDVQRPFQSVPLLRVGSPVFGQDHRARMRLAEYVNSGLQSYLSPDVRPQFLHRLPTAPAACCKRLYGRILLCNLTLQSLNQLLSFIDCTFRVIENFSSSIESGYKQPHLNQQGDSVPSFLKHREDRLWGDAVRGRRGSRNNTSPFRWRTTVN